MSKTIVFVSHATPEDNEFARWLTLQLNRRGYRAWCDLTKLLGGEDWWSDIEEAIKQHSCKFLLVGSRSSVGKAGVLRELRLALEVAPTLENFIIPLKLDDLKFSEFPEDLGSKLNVIRFDNGWASGLSRLLECLNRDGVYRDENVTAEAVSTYWRSVFPSDEGVTQQPEILLSNWLPIQNLPESIWLHESRALGRKGLALGLFRDPAIVFGEGLFTFSDPDAMSAHLRSHGARISRSLEIPTRTFLKEGSEELKVTAGEARKFCSSILRQGWEKKAKSSGMNGYTLSGGAQCFWFEKGRCKNDEYPFVTLDGEVRRRQLVGYKTVKTDGGSVTKQRYWHFALQARAIVWPNPLFALKTHVIFTLDGKNPIPNPSRQHSARRSQCKNWWNDDWRDRLLAMTNSLSGASSRAIRIQVSEKAWVDVASFPLIFNSPVTYRIAEQISRDDLRLQSVDDDDDEVDS